jgi:hypothetical protein
MCAFCYKKVSYEKLKRCGQCLARLYCSTKCQILDWGKSGQWHQKFCPLSSGEEGDAWDVRYISDAVGFAAAFGVFATKPFTTGQRIMVERAIPTELLCSRQELGSRRDSREESIHDAIMDLAPRSTETFMHKIHTNAISLGPSSPSTPAGICVRLSRVNHRCDNNADHYFIPHAGRSNGVCSLFATKAIQVNEQIFISYVQRLSPGMTIQEHASRLHVQYGITCNSDCVCKSAVYRKNILKANALDASIMALGSP